MHTDVERRAHDAKVRDQQAARDHVRRVQALEALALVRQLLLSSLLLLLLLRCLLLLPRRSRRAPRRLHRARCLVVHRHHPRLRHAGAPHRTRISVQ